ncbi:dapper homolog 3-like [Hylobates moloch]|uniref:dapper homolog 3-like n=1 Tax=Hylobates moloch TaxID=81572 RepID=UPI0026757FEC|nr:dapper homolog 3-like [Hylobates moloch]
MGEKKAGIPRGKRPPSAHARPPPQPAAQRLQPRPPWLPGGPRPLPRCSQERGHRGGAGRVPVARSPAGAAGADAAVAGWSPLPASTQATCATSCRRGVSTARNRNRAAAAAAVAALLPRGSRSAPASTGARPTVYRERGDDAAPGEGVWL